MILAKAQYKAIAGIAALAFLVAMTTSSEAGRRYSRGSSYGSSGGSSGSYGSSGGISGSYGSSGGGSGSYGSSGGLSSRRALRRAYRGSYGSSGGFHHSFGGSSYGSSGGSHGSSGGYYSHGSSGGYSAGRIIQRPSIRIQPSPPAVYHQNHAPAVPAKPQAPVKSNAPKLTAPPITPPQAAPKPVIVPQKKKDGQARMRIHVPGDAIVSLNHHQMSATGISRSFISPVLPTSDNYVYTVSVKVMREGKPVSIEQKQIVQAGGNYELTFVENNGALIFVDSSKGSIIAAQ